MRVVLRIASSLHRLLFRYAAVMVMAVLVALVG